VEGSVNGNWSEVGSTTATTPPEALGRDDELAALGADGTGGTLVVVIGDRGSGRTTLLDRAAAVARSAGRVVLHVDLGGSRPAWDEYGVGPLLDAVNAQFEGLGAGTDLMRSTAALRRRCRPETYRTATGRAAIHTGMRRLLTCLGPDVALVLFDDADRVPGPEHLAVAARQVGHRAIATATRSAALTAVADALVDIGPIDDDECRHLLRRALRGRPDRGLVDALKRALGPLWGNPAHMLSMVEQLHRTDRLVTVARRVCLREPHRTPTLSHDAPVVAAVGERGRLAENIVLLVDGPARVRVDDVPLLAAALGATVARTGRAVDHLVAEAILVERDGDLALRCPAVGATLRARADGRRVAALHAAVALAATDPVRATFAPMDPDVLAGHVAAAGEVLAPDPRWGTLLREQAIAEERRRPERAVHFLHAMRRHDTEGGGDRARTTEWLLRLLLRTGDHDGVARLVERVVGAGGHEPVTPGGVDRGLLAAAAAVAALSLHRPVSAAVRAALADDGVPTCPLGVAQRWSEGENVEADELVRALPELTTTLQGPGYRHAATLFPVYSAVAVRDVVGALAALLGPAYARPSGGPLVLLHRVGEAYRSGRWGEAVACARALFADHDSDERAPDLLQAAALIAADIATLQDDERMVAAWLQYVPDDPAASRHPGLHALPRVARLWASGDGEAALEEGWRAWNLIGPGTTAAGRRSLLIRLCGIAATERRQEWYPRLVGAAVEWCRTDPGNQAAEAAEIWDLVRGVLGEDDAAGRAFLARAVAPVRSRGHRAELAWVLLAAGAAVPGTSWSEAHAIADDIGSPVLRGRLRRLMDEQGVRPPTRRNRASELTDVQLRIVELVERGLTNRQIAREIRMSEKTVENHLTRLFVRFGCRTRHGLAAARLAARRDGLRAGA
jgi:DNA-binding CsgD family transcriptional regulator